MAMSKIERIDKEIAKTREKITEYQNKLRGLEQAERACGAENRSGKPANRTACALHAPFPA